MRSETLSETTRGRILDSKGAVLAEDEPCIDAASIIESFPKTLNTSKASPKSVRKRTCFINTNPPTLPEKRR